jgi:hypothetical protein
MICMGSGACGSSAERDPSAFEEIRAVARVAAVRQYEQKPRLADPLEVLQALQHGRTWTSTRGSAPAVAPLARAPPRLARLRCSADRPPSTRASILLSTSRGPAPASLLWELVVEASTASPPACSGSRRSASHTPGSPPAPRGPRPASPGSADPPSSGVEAERPSWELIAPCPPGQQELGDPPGRG